MPDNQQIFSHTYANGLVLVAQRMPWLESAAFSINLPAGCRFDPDEKIGLANFACEMVQRGCGNRDSRQFIEELESFGIDYSSSASVYHTYFGGAMCAGQLRDALNIYADVLQRPHLPEDQLEDGRLVCLQEIRSIEDDLAQRTLMKLRVCYYGHPDGRDCHGTMESVESISQQDIRDFFEKQYRPNGTIIGVAGKLDWPATKDHIGMLFSDWKSVDAQDPSASAAEHGMQHIPFESQQTHIAIAYPSVPYSHEDYFTARGSVGVLSDGMSSRLFTEVREKRGLCYSVFASSHSNKNSGCVICYAGTTADRAQETLDVLIEQLTELKLGIREDELKRLKVQIRSGLVMQQESCRSRAGAIAGDWFHLGRVRLLDELNERINSLTVKSINQYLESNPPGNFDIVTLGPKPLELSERGVSAISVG